MFGKVLILCFLALAKGTLSSRLWEPSELCPPIHEHYLLPHEYDCTKYYYCEYGMKYIEPRDCSPGTEFSYEQQVCVHPDSANCNLPGPPASSSTAAPSPTAPPSTTTTSTTTTTPASTTTSTTTTTTPASTTTSASTTSASTTVSSTTPCPCEDSGTDCEVDYNERCRENCNILPWAHATDCDKFWRCEGETAVRVVCAEGLHFNPSTGVCDFMCNANCVRRSTTTTTVTDGLKIFVPFSEINGASAELLSRIHTAIEHAKLQ